MVLWSNVNYQPLYLNKAREKRFFFFAFGKKAKIIKIVLPFIYLFIYFFFFPFSFSITHIQIFFLKKMTSSKWWWKKQPKTSSTKSTTVLPASSGKSITSNGADENASILSLYPATERGRDADSIFAHSYVASSTRAQHTRSEYSGNISDIESNTSILSKPWISRNLATNIASPPESSDDTSSIVSNQHSSSLMDDTTTNDDLLQEQHNQKRRGSLVDYFTVNKPLQGKLKVRKIIIVLFFFYLHKITFKFTQAGFGKLIRSQTNDTNHESQTT